QNGMRQAEIFNGAVAIDGVILSKYDSTAKGGMILSLAREYNLSTMFLGTGERYSDFEPFSSGQFLDELIGL
ncbi:MAG: signal recognition particle-docking protein FtsY, partial [Spirochaetaceae bacterium]|nr:signal recognition particle-docking protein FtsY [Spirochaetaceae bacterium]